MTPKQKKFLQGIPERHRKTFAKAYDTDNPLVAIRAQCIQCMAYQIGMVRKCSIETCPLQKYRMGKKISLDK